MSELNKSHTFDIDEEYAYALPSLADGPFDTEWEFVIGETGDAADSYPGDFMTFNSDDSTVEFSPDSDALNSGIWKFKLTVQDKNDVDATKTDSIITVTVNDLIQLTYTVDIVDNEAGHGQIHFNMPVNMVWLESNFDSFFKAKMLTADDPDGNEAIDL